MASEIKYRAWFHKTTDTSNGDFMLYSSGIKNDVCLWDQEPGKRTRMISHKINSMEYVPWVEFWDNVRNFFGKVTIMPYIGLKDKDGTDIFDGDIVTAWSQGSKGTFIIKWREDGGSCPCWLLYPSWQNGEMWGIAAYDRGLEIIGNIYDNPELVKQR